MLVQGEPCIVIGCTSSQWGCHDDDDDEQIKTDWMMTGVVDNSQVL